MRHYRDHDVAGDVTRKGEVLRRLYNEASAAAGLSGRGVGLASRMDIDFPDANIFGTHAQRTVFGRALLERGVLPVRVAFPCELMTDADLERVQHAFNYACKAVARYLDDQRASAAPS